MMYASLVRRALTALGALSLSHATLAQLAGPEPIAQLCIPGGVEIAAYDAISDRVLVTLSNSAKVAVLNLDEPASPVIEHTIDFSSFGPIINSVAANDGLCAAAIQAEPSTDPGWVVFFQSDGTILESVRVGAMPDMICFKPDGKYLLSANEGEPNADLSIDPPGTVTAIETDSFQTTTITLSDASETNQVNWFTPPEHTPASHIEPEYIAVAPDSSTAYVVCQENNAIAEIDLTTLTRVAWHPLGIIESPDGFRSLPQPDSIAAYMIGTELRLVTANEGDPREIWGTDGVEKFKGVEVARSSIANGQTPVRFGARSITVYNSQCHALWDSGSQLADGVRDMCDSGELSPAAAKAIAKRDDKRGVEPEGLAEYRQGDITHLYVGLERAGMVAHFRSNTSGDSFELQEMLVIPQSEPDDRLPAPEGLAIIPGTSDTNRPPMLLVTDEVFGTITLFALPE